MARWTPDARGRLAQAALELYAERGYDGTTVADIAQRAGLTKRTFFRHFADKREVLFSGGELLEQALVAGIAAAPADIRPVDAVAAGFEGAAAAFFADRHAHASRRQKIIDAHPELQERERIKLAALAAAIAGALRDRGVADSAALLAAETGVAVFRVAFQRWTEAPSGDDATLSALIRESLAELRATLA